MDRQEASTRDRPARRVLWYSSNEARSTLSQDRVYALESRSLLRRLANDRSGAIAVTTGLAMTMLLGFAGLAVDVGAWQADQRKMQDAADNAAYSAAVTAHNGVGDPTTSAKAIAASMGFPNGQSGIQVLVHNPPQQGKFAGNGNAWEVAIAQPQKMWFANLFLSSEPTASGRAVAHAQASTSPYCSIALHPSASGSVTFQGGGTVNLSGCNLQVNSTSSSALSLGGSSHLTADAVSVTGNYTVGSSSQLTVGNMDAPGAPTIPDPYASVPLPSDLTCAPAGTHPRIAAIGTVPNNNGGGAYCNGLSFTGNGTYVLDGTYVIYGSSSTKAFSVTSTGANLVTGPNGATIILVGNASVNITGGTLDLKAPTDMTNPYHGLVFFQDRNDANLATFSGASAQSYTGALYFPDAQIKYSGGSTSSSCTQIVASEIEFVGSSTLNSACTGTGIVEVSGPGTILAE